MKAGNNGNTEPYLVLLLMITGLYLAGHLIERMSAELDTVYLFLVWVHVKPFAMLVDLIPAVTGSPVLGNWLLGPAALAEAAINPWSLGTVPVSEADIRMAGARAAAAIYVVPHLLLILHAGKFRPDLRFRKTHDLDSLIVFQARRWPAAGIARHFVGKNGLARTHVSPGKRVVSVKGDLGNLMVPVEEATSPDKDSDALWPEIWLVENGLARPDAGYDSGKHRVRNYRDSDWQHLTLDALNEVLEGQLDETWQGFHRLKPHERALAAAFVCNHGYQPKKCRFILTELARIAESNFRKLGRFDRLVERHVKLMSLVDKILFSPDGLYMARITSGHAWKHTAFMVMLHFARKKRSVLSSAEFLWLKFVDRRLWYSLNCSGNAVAFAETAGIHAHYRAERQTGIAIHRPATNQTARSIMELYLDLSPEIVRLRRRRAIMHKSPGERIADLASTLKRQGRL